ncbi:MAG: glycosyl hydrolase [Kiritimatiellae bacterium]|nr:glycosyl hydrolase [Kiritimatiellia bacterium]
MNPTVVAALLWSVAAVASSAPPLEARFRSPPREHRPWAYWWWLKGNVDEETITRDLEAMKWAGFGGLLQFDVRGYHEAVVPPPPERTPYMSARWRELMRHALREADRLGLEVSINLSMCAGALMGPTTAGADAPKKLIWTGTEVVGPARLDCRLPAIPGEGAVEIALLAVRLRESSPPEPPAVHAHPAPAWPPHWRSDLPATNAPTPVAGEPLDLTDKHDAEGRLTWEIPPGRWAVIRFASVLAVGDPVHHGQLVTPFDVDVLDADAVRRHFERLGGELLKDAGPLAGRTLTHFYSVSWEGAAPTWTARFEEQFRNARGYALRPWLPVLAGFEVGGSEAARRFVNDYHATLAELMMNNFYGELQHRCHAVGLKWHAESGGPWNRRLPTFARADQLAFLGRTDMPQGEFWFTGGRAIGRPPEFNRPAAMAAHIYGRPLAAAEAFTHMVQHWSEHPAALKPLADIAFCDGINHLIWHTFTASPPEFGLPGVEYFAGSHLNPNVTWWPFARPFIEYLARCQTMLRHGRPVADLAVFIGEHPYQHWGRGSQWSERATLHPPAGHTYDLVNIEVLCSRLDVVDGGLRLPEGLGYRALVVDLEQETLRPEPLRRILELTERGATVILGQRRPTASSSLAGWPDADTEVRRLADVLWGAVNAASPEEPVRLGAGRVFRRSSVADAFARLGVTPNVEGPFEFAHRTDAETDVYFLTGHRPGDAIFRVTGRRPELWDPVTGTIRPPHGWSPTADGRTRVHLRLPTNGSTFVVFREPARGLPPYEPPPPDVEILSLTNGHVEVRVWTAQPVEWTLRHGHTVHLNPNTPPPLELTGPWTVVFESGRGAPPQLVMERLTDWTEHPDPNVRFFSGRATYRHTIELDADRASSPARLELHRVGVIARVTVNGRNAGILWTFPWEVELTGLLRAGPNDIEIEVANVWVNRLIGDASLPPEKRTTRTNVALQPGERTVRIYQGFGANDPLVPSGLQGPVRLRFGRDVSVRL